MAVSRPVSRGGPGGPPTGWRRWAAAFSGGAGLRRSPVIDVLQFAALGGALIWLGLRGAEAMGYHWQWYRVPRYLYRIIDGEVVWGPLVRGMFVTVELTAWSLVLTIAIGFAAALLRLSGSVVSRMAARVYLEVVRNTPLLVQLYLFFYILAPIFGLDRFWTGVLALAFFEGAFGSEIFRAGILSVGRGQWEAGASLGLGRLPTWRFIVVPQALRLVLPPLTSLRRQPDQALRDRERHRHRGPHHRGPERHRRDLPELRDLVHGRRHVPGHDDRPLAPRERAGAPGCAAVLIGGGGDGPAAPSAPTGAPGPPRRAGLGRPAAPAAGRSRTAMRSGPVQSEPVRRHQPASSPASALNPIASTPSPLG